MKLPSSWKKISIRQYYLIDTLLKDDTFDQADKDINLLCYLSGKNYEDILTLVLKEKRKVLKVMQFLNTLPSGSMHRRFRLKGKSYHVPRFKTITGGQYIDIMTFCKNPEADTREIHKILAAVCQPLKWGLFKTKYDGAKHAEIAEAFLDLPMSTAYPILLFFCSLCEILMKAMQDYLTEEIQTMKISLQDRIIANGTDG